MMRAALLAIVLVTAGIIHPCGSQGNETICVHPVVMIGELNSQNAEMPWAFMNRGSYNIVCPDAFKAPKEGSVWKCLDTIWVAGADCVPDDSGIIFAFIAIGVVGLFLAFITIITIMIKTSERRRVIMQSIIRLKRDTTSERLYKGFLNPTVSRGRGDVRNRFGPVRVGPAAGGLTPDVDLGNEVSDKWKVNKWKRNQTKKSESEAQKVIWKGSKQQQLYPGQQQ